MKKIIALCFLILFSLNNVVFGADVTITGISKLYIEYANGGTQEIPISPSINYTFPAAGSGYYQTNGAGTEVTLATSTLNQNSNIKRIALFCSSITHPGGTITINNYLGMTVMKSGNDNPFYWFDGYSAPITSWAGGTVDLEPGHDSQLTSGACDFNGTIVQDSAAVFTIGSGNSFDARNKKIHIRFKGVIAGVFMGSNNTTENL